MEEDLSSISLILLWGQHNDWRHLNICSSKTSRSMDYRNILTVQPIDIKIKSMCEFQRHCALINSSNLIYIEPMQELPVIITDHTHSIPNQTGLEDDNLIKINPKQTVPNQIPNRISLNIINAQSICGPSGKTEDFIDHVTGGQVDFCAVTETFLTEHNYCHMCCSSSIWICLQRSAMIKW